MAVMFQVVFLVMTPCSVVVGCCFRGPLHPKDGGSIDLWNDCILPQHYTMSQPRRPHLEKTACYEMLHRASNLYGFSIMT